MRENCVVTIRVLIDTDQEEKAKCYAEGITAKLLTERNLIGNRFVLDAEATDYGFYPGRTFDRTIPTNTTYTEDAGQ